MNIPMIFKIVLTTIDVIVAFLCLIAGYKEKDFSKFTAPIIFIVLNAGGLWL